MPKKDKENEVETNEVVVSETDLAIRAAFDENPGADEEVIKMAMLQAGCKIKSVTTTYNKFMVDSGQMATKEEKDDSLEANLSGMDLSDEAVFNDAVDTIKNDVTGATDKSASAMVRAWCKKNEVECYKKPAGAPRTDTFTHKFNEALIANPQMSEKECDEILAEGSGTASAKSYFQNLRKLGNNIYDSIVDADAAEAA